MEADSAEVVSGEEVSEAVAQEAGFNLCHSDDRREEESRKHPHLCIRDSSLRSE